ncbi:MAG: hypothetical protein ABIC57_02555 [bacterium]
MSQKSWKETDPSTGKTSGKTERDDSDSIHTTTFVDIPDVGSLRSSYDTDKETGSISDQHMTKQD